MEPWKADFMEPETRTSFTRGQGVDGGRDGGQLTHECQGGQQQVLTFSLLQEG